ncbi:MAG: aldehyde dehydrogenase family protein [Oscillospiraceae bacterium]|jgi:propionaldehyde dehydrogenase|nr:aldehyde dehydrogenase family protein [Oscillospiraceae bacterium]
MGDKKYLGVFDDIDEAIAAAQNAQKTLMGHKFVDGKSVPNYTIDDRQVMIEAIKKVALDNLDIICDKEVTESGYGRYWDKLEKNWGSFLWTPDTKDVPEITYYGSKGLTVEYYAPFGVIGAVTPVTNPASTIIANTICNLAVGNGVIFNPHPAAPDAAQYTCDLVNRAIVGAGGPENLVVIPSKPTLGTLDAIMHHPQIRLLLGTGGPAMVSALMASGKKVIAAGPGNPPSVIDSTADIKKAALNLTMSSTFDNNILCVGEKECFCVDEVFDEFFAAMGEEMIDEHYEAAKTVFENVVYPNLPEAERESRKWVEVDPRFKNKLLSKDDVKKLTELCLVPPKEEGGEWAANKKYVGKDAEVILRDAGIPFEGHPRLAYYEADNDDPFVQTEQMMPIFPIVRAKDFEDAVEKAVFAEHGNLHSASIWTKDLYKATYFGKRINTTVFVMNGRTFAAFGLGGQGSNSPTIATPTGEGVTGPQSFARKRRFVMADGQGFTV